MCEHNLKFERYYWIDCRGNCDNCGSPHWLQNMPAMYLGDNNNGHFFSLMMWCVCPGCRKNIDTYNYPCQGINITKDIKAMTA